MSATKKIVSTVLPLALVAVAMASSSAARADLSVSAVGVMNLTNLAVDPATTNTYSRSTGFGFGLLGATSIFPGFSLELGALYATRKVNVNDLAGNNTGALSLKQFQVPLLLRFTALPIVSIGAGPYYSRGVGSVTYTPANASGSTFDADYGGSGYNQNDFGVEASVAASIPLLPTLSLMGDVRYLFGLTNLDASGATTQHFRDIQVLAGVTFGI